jgi:hypothetical protein
VLSEETDRAKERARIARQGRIVLGVFLTAFSGFVLLAAPDLTAALVRDLPYLSVALLALFAGGILLGHGLGTRPPRDRR